MEVDQLITEEEQEQRAQDVRQAIHSIAMEGGQVTPETQADLSAYAAGEIVEDEVLARIRHRYGLPGAE